MGTKTVALGHVIAAVMTLSYAWFISQTPYVTTAIQFVTPFIIVLMVHTVLLAFLGKLSVGFSQIILARSAGTALGMIGFFALANITAPQPAMAANDVLGKFLGVLFCLVVLLLVLAILAFAILAAFRLIGALWRLIQNDKDGGNGTRLFDFASLGLVTAVLGLLSLEGLPRYYSFNDENIVVTTQMINSSAENVWQTMDQATSPDFPLPKILDIFPRPVAVVVDEGVALGANRRVEFRGREGSGFLSLKVVKRDAHEVVFEVLSDTSPYANWIEFQTLRYRVTSIGKQTRLDVSLEFKRRLAPSWFFTPTMKGAATLAMDVLARDVKTRTEMLHGEN